MRPLFPTPKNHGYEKGLQRRQLEDEMIFRQGIRAILKFMVLIAACYFVVSYAVGVIL